MNLMVNKDTFTIIHKDKKTSARIGILQTKKGKVETPFFMPVTTREVLKLSLQKNSKK